MIILYLPFPISTNALWRSAMGRVFISPKYKAWKHEADGMFLTQKKSLKPIKGNFTAVITLDERRRKVARDVDNRGKCLLDALQHFGLIEDDKFCDRITIQWGNVEGCSVVVIPVQEQVAA
jgi:Holliday junction resolvase RusA-like endonuclease